MIEGDGCSGLFGGIPVCIPTATFQVKRTGGYDLFGFFMALGTFDLFGAHFDKLFSNRTFTAFKLVNRHYFQPHCFILTLY